MPNSDWPVAAVGGPGPRGPRRGALDGERDDLGRAGQRRADVEHHLDVGAEQLLRGTADSGVNRCVEPSYTLRNVTPSSSTLGSSENTWKPPESVSVSPSQPANGAEPAEAGHHLGPGPQHQVVRVAEHDLDAERARSRRRSRYLMAPRVPTGMKHGVR